VREHGDTAWKRNSEFKRYVQSITELTLEKSKVSHYYMRAFDQELYPTLQGFGVGQAT